MFLGLYRVFLVSRLCPPSLQRGTWSLLSGGCIMIMIQPDVYYVRLLDLTSILYFQDFMLGGDGANSAMTLSIWCVSTTHKVDGSSKWIVNSDGAFGKTRQHVINGCLNYPKLGANCAIFPPSWICPLHTPFMALLLTLHSIGASI